MSASKIVLVLGAGGNVGASVAKLFAQKGYQVAIAARRLNDSTNSDGYLEVQTDLSKADSVEAAFEKVKAKFGSPNVVVYNAAAVHPVSAEKPLDLSPADLERDLAVNVTGMLVAARKAVEGFEKLPSETPKSFIYTGNFLNKEVMPPLMSLGIGKSASAHTLAVASKVYGPRGFCFYFADERKSDGSPAFRDISGANHAEHYLTLAESAEQKPWLQTFVGGQGYKTFL